MPYADLAGAPRVTAHTSSRAKTFTTMVTRNSASPISIRAVRCKSLTASVNSLAITAAMLYAGARSHLKRRTAADHHRHRHRFAQGTSESQYEAPTMPMRALRSTPIRIISHRVAPSASTASRCMCGTAVITSLVSDDTIGRIMIARMTPAAKRPMPKSGLKRTRPAQRLDQCRIHVPTQQRYQDKNPPQSVHDTGNRGQQLSQKRQDPTQRLRAHFRQKDSHSHRQRHRNHQGHHRRHNRSIDKGQRPEVAVHRVPRRTDKESPSEGFDGGFGLCHQFRTDQRYDGENAQRTQQHHPAEG